jgi:hypothetical protein
MQKITSIAGLKNAIQQLEIEQSIKGQRLKEQFLITYESLKPVNILRNTLREAFSSTSLTDSFSGTAFGAASGFLIKKLFVGRSGSALKKLLGAVVQFGVSKIISQNSEYIKAAGKSLFQNLFRKKRSIPE